MFVSSVNIPTSVYKQQKLNNPTVFNTPKDRLTTASMFGLLNSFTLLYGFTHAIVQPLSAGKSFLILSASTLSHPLVLGCDVSGSSIYIRTVTTAAASAMATCMLRQEA